MIGGLITAGQFGYAAVTGVEALVERCAKYAIKLALRSRQADDAAGEAMVERMRAAAPQLTGNLVNGIAWHQDGAATVVQASALRTSGGETWDYAAFTEFGTSREAAEPFFYDSAEQVLADRGTTLEDAAAAAGEDF